MKRKESVIRDKLLFTALILIIYGIGRYIPLYGVDTQAYAGNTINAGEMLLQIIGGDAYQYSLFALGISPHIIASLITQIAMLCMGKDFRAKVSPRKVNRVSVSIMLILAILQAVGHAGELKYVVGGSLFIVRIIVILEMVTGAMVVLMLANMNQKYGIGGQMILVLFNIIMGIRMSVIGHTAESLSLPILVSFVVMAVIVLMENKEKRIPLQRVSIHNIYADKNYMAIKYNPIGVMPVMFTSAFFIIPQLLVALLCMIFPTNQTLIWWQNNLNLSAPLGIAVYIIVEYLLTIGFSFVFINPKDTMEQLLKSGDSILNIHAGKDTKRYLRRNILAISFLSATVMGICLGIPLFLQLRGDIDGTLAMLPSSAMMMVGMMCNFAREIVAVRSYDAYQQILL